MAIDAAAWYDPDPDQTSRYQGDVISGVPVVFMPPQGDGPWVLLRPSRSLTLEQALAGSLPSVFRPHVEGSVGDVWQHGRELVLARASKMEVMILTQTCDIEHRKWIQVAPVFKASDLSLSAQKQASIEANEITYMFYLPEAPPRFSQKGFADFSKITSVHNSYLRDAMLVERLTPRATAELQSHLAKFYGRPFGFNVRDRVPQSGEYICAYCFYSAVIIQRSTMTAGTLFTACSACGEDALWVKSPAAGLQGGSM